MLKYLELTNLRKIPKKELTFSKSTTIMIGPNASGKTTVLEAIYMLATGKSFRADRDSEVISFGKELARVKGRIWKKEDNGIEESLQLEEVITRGEVIGVKTPMKKYSVNGVGKHSVDFVGNLKAVLFWPQDLELVTDSPSHRRRYLDSVLVQVDREYRRSLLSYERGVRQRNKLLEAIRDRGAHHHQLMFWDQLLISNGEYITKKRGEYIDYINKSEIPFVAAAPQGKRYPKSLPRRQAGDIPKLKLVYDMSIISRQRLDQYSQEEVAAGVTLVGPHRDDFQFEISQKDEFRNLSHFGSRGEQRLGVLWLKLGELSFIENRTGEKPILLLDDILSELDHEHRIVIFEMMGNQQTILTTTDSHFLEKNLKNDVELLTFA
jgi:DNA replication and repair protein RecF